MTNQTKQWIFESFIDLVQEHEYNKISISMIMENAQLSRRTFYRFFKSKDDLLQKYFLKLFDGYKEYVSQKSINSFSELIFYFFSFWNQYRSILAAFQKQNLLILAVNIYDSKIIQEYSSVALPWHKYNLSKEQIETITRFFVGGLWNVFISWDFNNKQSIKEITNLVVNSISIMSMQNKNTNSTE